MNKLSQLQTEIQKRVCVLSFYIAIRRKDSVIVQKIIEEYPYVLTENIPDILLIETYYSLENNHPFKTSSGMVGYSSKMETEIANNLLGYAVHFDTFEIFQMLLCYGTNINNVTFDNNITNPQNGYTHHAFTKSLEYSEYLCNRGINVTLADIKYKLEHCARDVYMITFLIRKYLLSNPSFEIFEVFDIVDNKYTFNKIFVGYLKQYDYGISRLLNIFQYMPVPSLQHLLFNKIKKNGQLELFPFAETIF